LTDRPLSNFNAALAEQAGEEARLALAPFEPRRQGLRAALYAVDVKDDEDLRRAIDKISLSKALREAADAALQPIGKPYREAAHAVASAASAFMADLLGNERHAYRSIESFRSRQREAAAQAKNDQAERERLLRQQAGLESTPALPIKPADIRLGSVRSDYRGQVFDRKVLHITITDPRLLPDDVLNAPFVIDALIRAVRTKAALTRDIPGATIEDDQKSTVKAG
jgi:hypothetical protein